MHTMQVVQKCNDRAPIMIKRKINLKKEKKRNKKKNNRKRENTKLFINLFYLFIR